MKTVDVRAAIARRGDVDDRGRPASPCCSPHLVQQPRHVFADGFGQAGRGGADELRLILAGDLFSAGVQILAAAENRAVLVKLDDAMSIGSRKWLMR